MNRQKEIFYKLENYIEFDIFKYYQDQVENSTGDIIPYDYFLLEEKTEELSKLISSILEYRLNEQK